MTRHPSCAGCCTCGGTVLSIVPSAEPLPQYLMPAGSDGFFRPRDFFQVQIAHRRLADHPDDHHRAQLEAAWRFRQTHGRDELIAALTQAARMTEGLTGPLADLLAQMTEEIAA